MWNTSFEGYKGLRIGVDRSKPIHPASHDMPSALQLPHMITKYLSAEIKLGRILGPFHPGLTDGTMVQINRFSDIPKRHSGKWRLFTDLSYPQGYSVNDAIDPAHCLLMYTMVEKVV